MRIALIIANDGYQDVEYETPKNLLQEQGFTVSTVAKELGTANGSLGGQTEVNLTLDECDPQEFDAIAFIGGPGAPIYQDDPRAKEIIKQTLDQQKLLAAICIAPMTLAKAGALRGKNATVWNGDTQQAAILETFGATYHNEPVITHDNIITANGPAAAKDFAKAIISYLTAKTEDIEANQLESKEN